jgi:dTDP-4-dehydrorhamnose 3,5-epimerase
MTPEGTGGIAGVEWGSLSPVRDDRGAFREIWRASNFRLTPSNAGSSQARFSQANLSTSAAGVLRGLHYHRRQLDYWMVVAGRVFVALVDVRSALRGGEAQVETRELSADDTVTIPIGVAHGFLALEPTQLLYLVTNEYDGTDELGFAWDDPAVAVPWPLASSTTDIRPILSDRDRANPPLGEVLRRLSDGQAEHST